jgi:RHS repeat-associated protein
MRLIYSHFYKPKNCLYGKPIKALQGSKVCYRFSFNGMERDNEVKGNGNSYDFGARVNDPRLGRWLSCDPHEKRYPGFSPYMFANSNPIFFMDYNGKDGIAKTTIATGDGAGTLKNPNSIEISATYYYPAGADPSIPAALNAACAEWSNSTAVILREDGQYYKITFKLEAKEGGLEEAGGHVKGDGAGNYYTNGNTVSGNILKADEGDLGQNWRTKVGVDMGAVEELVNSSRGQDVYNKHDLLTEIFKHEIGHNLGLGHSKSGLMKETIKLVGSRSLSNGNGTVDNKPRVPKMAITKDLIESIMKNAKKN